MALQEPRKVRTLSLAGIAQVSNDVSRKFLDRSDLSRLLRIASNFLKDHTQVLTELDNFFVHDPTAKIKLVFVDDTVLVKNIFVMSSSMQELAQKSPENLYVDLQSDIVPGLNLYSVSCEDESGWKMCASCISKTNNQDTLRFLIVSVLQSIPKMKAQIKSIIVHPEIGDSIDLSALLPNASFRYCMSLILRVLELKVANLPPATQSQIKSVLQALFHSRSLKVYNRHLSELKALSPESFFQYYMTTWHPSRKEWCTKDTKRIKTEKTLYSYSVSLHYTLSSKFGILPSLYQCLRVILQETIELQSVPEALMEFSADAVPDPSSTDAEEVCEETKNELEQMEFYSWDEFQNFLNLWCEEQKILFIIRNAVPLNSEDMSQELVQTLKYSMVNLGCSSYTRKRCSATIQLRLGPEMDKLIITKADLTHSHDSDIDLPTRYTKKPESFVEVPAILSPENSDKFMDRTDLTKLLRLHFPFGKESQFLDELESLFNTDPGVKVKLSYADEKFTVKNIFVMTTAMQNWLQNFSEHLFIAFLPSLNQEYTLYSVLCQDETFSWKVCAHCITRKNSSDPLKFIILTLLQVAPNLSTQLKCLTLSPDIQNPSDMQVLLPNVAIKQCLPFVFEFMHQKISFLSQMEQSQIKNLLINLAQASSSDAYTQYLKDLKVACPDEVFQYYFDNFHSCWDMWSGKDSSTSDMENSICDFVKLYHQELRAQLGPLPSLSQCIHAIFSEDRAHDQEPSESSNTCVTDANFTMQPESMAFPPLQEADEESPEVVTNVELTKVQDGEEVTVMQLNGREFQSWNEFRVFLQGWTNEKYILRSSCPIKEEDGKDKPALSETFKYSWAQFSCGWKSCSAFIELVLNPQKEKLIVTQSCMNHTHVAEDCEAPPEKKFRPSTAVGVPAQVANNISKKLLEPSDLKRLLRFRSGAFEDRTQVLGELQSLFSSDPEAKVKLVFVEDKLHVKLIFLMTSAMRQLVQNSPEYLFIDMFSDFSPSFDLYTVFCEVKGSGWIPCAFCIAKKRNEGIISFLTGLLVEVIPVLSNKVKVLTLHPDIQELINLEAHLPHAHVRYCMHLVLNLMYIRIGHLSATAEAQIKNFLHILSQTCSLKVYDRYLNDLKAVCPADVYKYYIDTWHPRRKLWVKKDNRTEESERNICELVTANHAKLKAEVGFTPSLYQCLCSVLGSKAKTSFCDSEKTHSPTSNQQLHSSTTTQSLLSLSATSMSELGKPQWPLLGMSTMNEAELELMEFFSWEQFCIFFDDWCEKMKTLYTLRKFTLLQKCKWATDTPQWEAVEALKYSSVRLACRNVYVSRKRELTAPNPGKAKTAGDEEESQGQQSCGAYILLKLSEQKNSLVITKCQLQHNHPLCPHKFQYHFKRGHLLANCCLPVRTTNRVSKQFLGALDIKNLLSCCKTTDHGVMDILQSLDGLFTLDSGAKVKLVFLPDQVIVKTIFIVTSEMASTCKWFPTVLIFFRVMSFNNGFDLFSFLCGDNFGQGKVCAYVLVRKGTSDILRFASASLVQSIPYIKLRVRCVIVSLDIGEKEVLKEFFPRTVVQLMPSQVLETLHKQALEMGTKDDKMLLPLFSRIACSETSESYQQALRSLDQYCTGSFVKYFMDQWHTCQDMWVNMWGYNLGRLNVSEIVTCHTQMLTELLGSNPTVAECILHLTAPTSMKSGQHFREKKIAMQYKNVCTPDAASMIEEELGFLVDCKYSFKQTPNGFSLQDGLSEFFMDPDLVSCSCTIHASSLLPCRHLFAARLWNKEDLFDLNLLAKEPKAKDLKPSKESRRDPRGLRGPREQNELRETKLSLSKSCANCQITGAKGHHCSGMESPEYRFFLSKLIKRRFPFEESEIEVRDKCP
ncbi:uncharacterized protein ZSWIM9 [Gastrophryne carolinensis]